MREQDLSFGQRVMLEKMRFHQITRSVKWRVDPELRRIRDEARYVFSSAYNLDHRSLPNFVQLSCGNGFQYHSIRRVDGSQMFSQRPLIFQNLSDGLSFAWLCGDFKINKNILKPGFFGILVRPTELSNKEETDIEVMANIDDKRCMYMSKYLQINDYFDNGRIPQVKKFDENGNVSFYSRVGLIEKLELDEQENSKALKNLVLGSRLYIVTLGSSEKCKPNSATPRKREQGMILDHITQ